MLVSRTVSEKLQRSSWIRRMFEEGARLKAERGAENVFDFSIGNPEIEPPDAVLAAARRLLSENRPGTHAYMPNAGFPDVRAALAARMARDTGLPFTAQHVVMTVGAGGALNVVLKAALDPGDEVIVVAPYFVEYGAYVDNHGGTLVVVESRPDFQLDVEAIGRAITPKTRAILLNSPNNPTGVIYPAEAYVALEALLARQDRPLLVISDEPYKALTFGGVRPPEIQAHVTNAVVATSWSKALALPGERIGMLAVSPRIAEARALADACTYTLRTLGFVNAPALWQRVIAETSDAAIDVGPYQEKVEILHAGLVRAGYECTKPQGAFYLFPKTPLADDVAFVRLLVEEGVLAVPGSGFGRAGHMRLSVTVPKDTVVRSIPAFERAIRRATAQGGARPAPTV